MRIASIFIKNFGSCEEVRIECGSVQALVGANNAGKSNFLRALDFFFNPSASKITKDTFWNHDVARLIWVEITFVDLAPHEREQLGPYLRPDGAFQMARSAVREGDEENPDELKIVISQHYCAPMPRQVWLRPSEINGARIDEWWVIRDTLRVGAQDFGAFVGPSKPKVGVWRERAVEFAARHLTAADMEDVWGNNPQGYANVLKGTLPHFILVPAVRDLTDEAKATKTNPFGRLLYQIVASVTADQRTQLDGVLSGLKNQLNRVGGAGRLDGVVRTERRLNEILKEYMNCDLEIEFQPPTLEVLLTTPKLLADDGFRNAAEAKGHGLQRAIIFSILRCYAESITGAGDARRKRLVFAVEEPETYMHPQAQRTNRRVFLDLAAAGDQVFFSTHSALMLDVARFDEIVRVEAVVGGEAGRREVRSRVWQLSMSAMLADLRARHPGVEPTPDAIRELYMNAYHPSRSEGCFAQQVILVEGATEQYALPIYAEALGYRLDERNIAIVDCGGKGSMDRLYRVFNELGIACFLLFDYDRDSREGDSRAVSRKLLGLVGQDPAPSDEVRVMPMAACFPRKWEDTLATEIQGYVELAAAARRALGLSGDSGKPLVARFMARQAAQQVPPAVPPSIRAILEMAVGVTWQQSCLQKQEADRAGGAAARADAGGRAMH